MRADLLTGAAASAGEYQCGYEHRQADKDGNYQDQSHQAFTPVRGFVRRSGRGGAFRGRWARGRLVGLGVRFRAGDQQQIGNVVTEAAPAQVPGRGDPRGSVIRCVFQRLSSSLVR